MYTLPCPGGHRLPISCMLLRRALDRLQILTGSPDRTICVRPPTHWERTRNHFLISFAIISGESHVCPWKTCCSFSDPCLSLASWPWTQVWDVDTGTQIRRIAEPIGTIKCLLELGHGLFCSGGQVRGSSQPGQEEGRWCRA